MRIVLALVFAAGLVACSNGTGLSEVPAGRAASPPVAALPTPADEPAPGGKVIGVLQLRDERATLFAASDGLHVTVRDASGALLAQDVRVEDLRERDPFLYEVCRSSVAMNHSLDARVDPPLFHKSRGASGILYGD